MRYKIIFFLFTTLYSYSQTNTKNYIIKTIFREENNQKPEKTIEYFDAFGRSIEKNMYQQGTNKTDLISYNKYDSYGNEIKSYLPYSDDSSNLDSRNNNLESNTQNYYNVNYGEPNIYFTELDIEKSPLKRVKRLSHPGEIWKMGSGKEIKNEFTFNSIIDSVINYKVLTNYDSNNNIFNNTFSNENFITYDKLYKKIIKNENWVESDGKNNTIEIYTNSIGDKILQREFNEDLKHDTYYLYDKFGNLAYILPPNVNHKNLSLNEIENLIYQYKYDDKDRVVEKKKPNRGWEKIVFDNRDRIILEQNILQNTKEWVFKKYDNLGRIVYSGIFKENGTRSQMQKEIDNLGINHSNIENRTTSSFSNNNNNINYTNNAFPSRSLLIDNINYYDYYNILNNAFTSNAYGHQILYNTKKTKGLLIANQQNLIDTDKWNKEEYYYDQKYKHLIATRTSICEGGDRLEDLKIDFLGNIHESLIKQRLKPTLPYVNVTNKYYYYDNLSLQKITQKINNSQEQLLFKQELDPFGKVIVKKIGGTDTNAVTSLQKTDFKYNIRGWLTEINDLDDLNTENDVFAYRIGRERIGRQSLYNLYNGNISSVIWRSKKDNIVKRYLYEYDHLNRLKEGGYYNQATFGIMSGWISKTGAFKEKLTYDKIGNITSLHRTSDIVNDNIIEIDELNYEYDGNKVIKISDATNNPEGFNSLNLSGNIYEYDLNGNLIVDKNKGISDIKYNYLNLPSEIKQGANTLKYFYTPNGNKVKKILETPNGSTITTYLNEFEYTNDDLSILKHSDGYITPNGNDFQYTYIFKDHLGSTRLSYTDLNKNNIIEFSEIFDEYIYYPFGLMHHVENNNLYKHKYQGIEKENDLNLGWYNFKYRTYNPEIGRFLSVDPLSDKYDFLSNFSYTANNPLSLIDIDGREIYVVSNGLEFKYTRNLITFSNDPFVIMTVNALNTLNATRIGNKILTPLINSSEKFYISNTFSYSGTTMTYDFSTKHINAANKDNNDFFTYTSSLGHELYHGLQDLFGLAKRSINVELEAYIIDNMLNYELTGFPNDISSPDQDGTKFSQNYEPLFTPEVQMNNKEFDMFFKKSLELFKKGTYMGKTGVYDNFIIENRAPSNLLKSFFITPFNPINYYY